MQIRDIHSDDIPVLVRLDRLCFPLSIAFPSSVLKAYLKRKNIIARLWEDSDRIIAFIMGFYDKKAAEIVTLDVHPGYRRIGLGRRLLQLLEKEAENKGIEYIFLHVAVENQPAIRLYRQEDFQEIGRRTRYYGTIGDAILMMTAVSAVNGDGLTDPACF